MSNTLVITLTEFRTRGANSVLCGIHASDDYKSYTYMASDSWEKFKSEFPTLASVVFHVAAQEEFEAMSGCLKISGDDVSFEKGDEDAPYSGLYFEGVDGLYDQG